MEFKEAKKIVINLRGWIDKGLYNDRDKALLAFDSRITELEKRIDDMAEQAILLTQRIAKLAALRDELQKEIDDLCSVESVIY